MKYSEQKPNNADADSRGQVLGWNKITKGWYCTPWTAIEGRIWTDWQKLPDAPVVEAKVGGAVPSHPNVHLMAAAAVVEKPLVPETVPVAP